MSLATLHPDRCELICMVGLPYSGKSTQARMIKAPIVNPDAIRMGLHGQRFATPAEPIVWSMVRIMVVSLFLAGHNKVVLDACNTTRKRRDPWQDPRWHTSFLHIHTDVETCYKRANAVEDAEIMPSIGRMSEAFEPLDETEFLYSYRSPGF